MEVRIHLSLLNCCTPCSEACFIFSPHGGLPSSFIYIVVDAGQDTGRAEQRGFTTSMGRKYY